jgi:hypothetical protein
MERRIGLQPTTLAQSRRHRITKRAVFEPVVLINMQRGNAQNESRMIAAAARREPLAEHAGYVMRLYVSGVVYYSVNARMRNLITGLEFITNPCHLLFPFDAKI